MADETFVTVERRDDGVAVVELQRPKVNALSKALLLQLRDIADDLTADPPGAVVITGGERAFSAGAEISEFGGPIEAREIGGLFRDALGAVAAIPRFTIAAINRVALGGGCELALCCDWRICSDNAVLGQPEVLLGIIPGGGGTQRLPRLVGPAKAKEIMITGRQVRSEEALRIGMVDEIVPASEVLPRALLKAAEVAQGAVVAQGSIKAAVDEGIETTLAWGIDREQLYFVDVFDTEDSRIGVKSFLEHGPGQATFTGK
ncbi:MAG: putative enoyl-CoA hydratase [Acidimicrobiales bacterium]|nr:putative enoyl-CoA hydratase [Acidimicrobiales bacterium]